MVRRPAGLKKPGRPGFSILLALHCTDVLINECLFSRKAISRLKSSLDTTCGCIAQAFWPQDVFLWSVQVGMAWTCDCRHTSQVWAWKSTIPRLAILGEVDGPGFFPKSNKFCTLSSYIQILTRTCGTHQVLKKHKSGKIVDENNPPVGSSSEDTLRVWGICLTL